MISPRDDTHALRQRFLQHGRVLIPGIFEPAFAQGVLDAAHGHAGWLLVTRIEGTHREFDAALMEQVPKDRLQTFDELVAQEARKGFQYRFERHLLYDNLRAGALAEGPLGREEALRLPFLTAGALCLCLLVYAMRRLRLD